MSKRLRLVKLIVQPVFVVDDGDVLVEQVGQPVAVPAADLDGFVEKFRGDVALAEMQLNEQAAAEASA